MMQRALFLIVLMLAGACSKSEKKAVGDRANGTESGATTGSVPGESPPRSEEARGTAPAPAAQTDDVNAAAVLAGARYFNASGDSVDASNSQWGDGQEGKPGELLLLHEEERPAVRILELAEPFDLTRLELINIDDRGPTDADVKRLRVEVGPSLTGPWKALTEVSVAKGTAPQSFPITASKARYLRISLLENYGYAATIGLGELRLLGTRSAPRPGVDFTGTYGSDVGAIKLVQSGQRVTGCFDKSVGGMPFEGAVDGVILSGFYTQAGEGPVNVSAALNAEGELRGTYGSTPDYVALARFDGSKLPPDQGEFSCQAPENQIAEKLKKDGRVALRGILFDTGKDVIRGESIPVLEALVAALRGDDRAYLIEGHTDDRGGAAYNLALSDKRAAAVRKWLVDHGVSGERLQTKGFGLTRPAMSNDSEAGRAANRRVEVVRK